MTAGRYDDLLAELDELVVTDPSMRVARALKQAAAALRESEEENRRLRGPASVEMADVIREVGDLVLFRDDPAFAAHVAALEARLKAAARVEVETLRTELEHERAQRWQLARLDERDLADAHHRHEEAITRLSYAEVAIGRLVTHLENGDGRQFLPPGLLDWVKRVVPLDYDEAAAIEEEA